MTAGGRSFTGRAREYMDRLAAQSKAKDPTSNRRHHYVPQSYLREWSFDRKRVWTLDTVTGSVRPMGLASVCVEENFHRVVGPDGVAHNRVELLFGVVDNELRRVQILFNELKDPESLEFDDLLGLGISMAVQRMRTAQERRLRSQHNAWLIAQSPHGFKPLNDPSSLHHAAGIHTQILFESMWDAADVLTTRQIEIWQDPKRRFLTCDAPVIVPFEKNVRSGLLEAPYVIWPVSPQRAVALSKDFKGEKAVIYEATGKHVGIVREGVEQGRERMIFATEEHRDKLPARKKFMRRAQSRIRCSNRTPSGGYVEPPGCCVEWRAAYAAKPDVALCDRGLHIPAPDMWL